MPNSIIVGDKTYSMCSDYIQGALHERVGLKSLFKDNGTEQWKIGARNERGRHHLRFDTDILTEKDIGSVFAEDPESGVTAMDNGRWVMSEGNYRIALLTACGAYHAFDDIADEKGWMGAGEIRKKLSERGIWIGTEDCTKIWNHKYHERELAKADLSEDEVAQLDQLTDPQRRILEICSDARDEDWSYHTTSWYVSSKARRNEGWAASTVLKMERNGFGHLIRATGNGWVDISPKGILAVRHMRAMDAELGRDGLAPAERMPYRPRWRG